jgi:hypothetical protein
MTFKNYSIMSLGKGFENPHRERKQFLFLECKLIKIKTYKTNFLYDTLQSQPHENTPDICKPLEPKRHIVKVKS